MKRQNSLKKAFALSVLSTITCLCLLIGSTFAWFTSTVTSNGNKIVAGNLDVDLVMDGDLDGTYTSIAGIESAIFSDSIKWEPGMTQIVYLGVQNKGSLALQYNIVLNVSDQGLVGSLEYAIIDGAKYADLSSATNWTQVKGAAGSATGDVASGKFVAAENGVLDEIVNGTNNETDYFALAIHMKETAGNEYMNKGITIDVQVIATQYSKESDSFGPDYDASATFPALAPYINTSTNETFTNDEAVKTIKHGESDEENDTLKSSGELTKKVRTTESTSESVTIDISFLYKEDGTEYDVTEFGTARTTVIQLSTGLKNVKVTRSHGGVTTAFTKATSESSVGDGEFFYNSTTGKLTVTSSKYSDFIIEYTSDFTASVSGQGYNSLQEAIDAAKDGQTVYLLKSTTINNSDLKITDKNISIDGLNHKVEVSCDAEYATSQSNYTYGLHIVGDTKNINVNIKDLTINATGAVRYSLCYDGSEDGSYCASGTISNCTVTCSYCGLGVSGNDYGDSNVVLNNCNISHIEPDAAVNEWLNTAVAPQFDARVTINGGTYTSTQYGVYIYSTGGIATINSGTITAPVALKAQYSNSYSTVHQKSEIFVNGGTINGSIDDCDGTTEFVEITGGKFSVDPSTYVKDGYEWNSETKYVIADSTLKVK